MALGGLGKALGLSGKSGGSSTTTSTEPWKEAKPYFQDLYRRADTALKNTAGPSQAQQNVWTGLDQVSQTAGMGGQQYQDLAMRVLNGDFLNPATNPHFAGMQEAAIRPMTENFTRNVLPQLGSQAIAQGAYGGSRQGVVEANAAKDLNRAVGDVTSNLAYTNYMTERQNQLAAPQMFAQALQMQMAPWQLQQQIADSQYAQQWTPLQQFSNILSASPFTTTTQTGSGTQSSALGGLAGLANIGAGLFGQSGAFPGVFGG